MDNYVIHRIMINVNMDISFCGHSNFHYSCKLAMTLQSLYCIPINRNHSQVSELHNHAPYLYRVKTRGKGDGTKMIGKLKIVPPNFTDLV